MTACVDTPIGRLSVSSSDGYVTSIAAAPNLDGDENIDDCLNAAIAQLEEYFAGRRKSFSVPVSFHGTAFQEAVWNELQRIPYGETRSYRDIAAAIGHPGAVRAVGNAVGKNPIPIIIPCHRVIRTDHTLGGFSLIGPETKRKLLASEGIAL